MTRPEDRVLKEQGAIRLLDHDQVSVTRPEDRVLKAIDRARLDAARQYGFRDQTRG